MLRPDGTVRPHYAALASRLATLTPEALQERQKTQERFFLLQGITFTVYGAESSTERIIPSDILPRIIAAAEWATVEAGLIQRLQALNMFLADIYSEPDGWRGAAGTGAAGALVPARDAEPLCPAQGLRERLRLGPDPPAGRGVCGAGGQPARPLRRFLHAGQSRGLAPRLSRHLPLGRGARHRPLSRPVAVDAEEHGRRLAAEPAGRGADAGGLQLRLLRARLPGPADGRAPG